MTLFRAHTLRATLACVLLSALATAQTPYSARHVTLASAFDLDGEAADDDQVVAVVALTDGASFTVAANPDICRLLDITVTDANSSISAGVLTVTGTDCWDRPLVATFTFAAGGSGVKTLTVAAVDSANPVLASGAYFKTVTTVTTGTLTGEGGGDTVIVGYTSNSAKTWVMHGRQSRRSDGSRYVDVLGQYDVNVLVTTSGSASTTVAAVAASTTAPFENVSVGDFLVFNIGGQIITRRVTAKASADSITVDTAINIASTGLNFSYRKLYVLADPIDGWISVLGYGVFSAVVEVDANASTGGVTSSVECSASLSDELPNNEVVHEVDTDNVATAATGTAATSVILRELPHYTHCRVGIKFGTGDDGDTAVEDIDIAIALAK